MTIKPGDIIYVIMDSTEIKYITNDKNEADIFKNSHHHVRILESMYKNPEYDLNQIAKHKCFRVTISIPEYPALPRYDLDMVMPVPANLLDRPIIDSHSYGVGCLIVYTYTNTIQEAIANTSSTILRTLDYRRSKDSYLFDAPVDTRLYKIFREPKNE